MIVYLKPGRIFRRHYPVVIFLDMVVMDISIDDFIHFYIVSFKIAFYVPRGSKGGCIDINPERMPVHKAVEINCYVLGKMNDRINSLPHKDIIDAYYDPENNRGTIEEILAKTIG